MTLSHYIVGIVGMFDGVALGVVIEFCDDGAALGDGVVI